MKFSIRHSKNEDKEEIAELIKESFSHHTDCFNPDGLTFFILDCENEKDDLVMEIDGRIIGCHLFTKSELDLNFLGEHKNFYKNKKGMCGFLFCIHPNYQRKGLGSKFIQFEREYFKGKYDYIWGEADKRLNNSGFWLNNRDIIINKKEKGLTTIQNLMT